MIQQKSLDELIDNAIEISFIQTQMSLNSNKQSKAFFIDKSIYAKLRKVLESSLKKKDNKNRNIYTNEFFLLNVFSNKERSNNSVDLVITEFMKKFILTIKNTNEYLSKTDQELVSSINFLHKMIFSNYKFYKLDNSWEEIKILFENYFFDKKNPIVEEIGILTKDRIEGRNKQDPVDEITSFFNENYLKNTLLINKHYLSNNTYIKNLQIISSLRLELNILYFSNKTNLRNHEPEFNIFVNQLNEIHKDNEKVNFEDFSNVLKFKKEKFIDDVEYQKKIVVEINPVLFTLYMGSGRNVQEIYTLDKHWRCLTRQFEKIINNNDSAVNNVKINFKEHEKKFNIEVKFKENAQVQSPYTDLMADTIIQAFKQYMRNCSQGIISGENWEALGESEIYATELMNTLNDMSKYLTLSMKLDSTNSQDKNITKRLKI